MNRISQFTIIIALAISQNILAADLTVADVKNNISVKQSDYNNYNISLETQTSNALSIERDLGELRQNA